MALGFAGSVDCDVHCAGCESSIQLKQLHELLHSMCCERVADDAAFHRSFRSKVLEVLSLVESCSFAGYALAHGQAPSVLHLAAGCGCLEACASILRRCKRLNFISDQRGQTPLFWALEEGLCGTVELLLQNGADVYQADGEGRVTLHVVAQNGLPRCCAHVLKALRQQDRAPFTASMLEQRNRRGLTSLHIAAQQGHRDVAQLLLQASADAMSLALQGRTPLHLAASGGHVEVGTLLLQAAPIAAHTEDAEGLTPLSIAVESGACPGELLRALSSNANQQLEIQTRWQRNFEPACRSSMNVPACAAFLEIGRPKLISVEHMYLRLTCHVVDSLGAIEAFLVEVMGKEATVHYPRKQQRQLRDDIELRVPRTTAGETLWDGGDACQFRVHGVLTAQAARLGSFSDWHVTSAWSQRCIIPGVPATKHLCLQSSALDIMSMKLVSA
mmetsp:Transcript_76415/g.181762  ORF Transcript_76415/g.181762 Transcript_76415/m.181762 type:complete len:444 (+) Transcript_76415:88-1419(+)